MRKWLGIGLILIAIGVAGFFYAWNKDRGNWMDTVTVDEQHQVSAEGVKRVSVETDTENVRIVEGTQSDIVIRVEGKVSTRFSDRTKLEFNVSDGTLHVRTPEWSFSFGYMIYGLDVTVEVPSAAYESLVVETDSGNIDVSGLAFGQMKLDTDSSDMLIQGTKTNSIDIDTDSGDVVIEDTEGKMAVNSDSGDFLWKGPQLAWPAEVESDSGDVAFNVGTKPDNARVKFKSDSGDGVIEWNGTMADSGHSVQEAYGNGALLINVVTDSGDFIMTDKE